jgi:hypothetical protein
MLAASAAIYYNRQPAFVGAHTEYSTSARFLDIIFVVAAILALVYYFALGTNFRRSFVRYLYFGLTAYIPMQSAHSYFQVSSRGELIHSQSSTPGQYACFAGEIVGYIGLLLGYSMMTGSARTEWTLSRTVLILACVCMIAGTVVLGVNFTATSERNNALQILLFPTAVVILLVAGGLFRQLFESIHAAFFFIAYYGIWILPNIDLVIDNSTEQASRIRLAGLIYFGAVALAILPAFFSLVYHRAETVLERLVFLVAVV